MTTSANLTTIEALKPAAVWRLFAEMSNVPRPSEREERILRTSATRPRSSASTCARTASATW